MKAKRMALLLLAVFWIVGCQNDDAGPTIPNIIITNNNTNNNGQPGPSDDPSVPPTTPAHVNLGCFGMSSGGTALPDCAANLATYNAPVGTNGTLDATPLDAAGNKIDGLSVEGWDVAPASGGPCSITGETFGPDGFNPSIELTDVGCCAITVTVAGKVGGPRQFCGQ